MAQCWIEKCINFHSNWQRNLQTGRNYQISCVGFGFGTEARVVERKCFSSSYHGKCWLFKGHFLDLIIEIDCLKCRMRKRIELNNGKTFNRRKACLLTNYSCLSCRCWVIGQLQRKWMERFDSNIAHTVNNKYLVVLLKFTLFCKNFVLIFDSAHSVALHYLFLLWLKCSNFIIKFLD